MYALCGFYGNSKEVVFKYARKTDVKNKITAKVLILPEHPSYDSLMKSNVKAMTLKTIMTTYLNKMQTV